MPQAELAPFTRRRIEAIVERTLARAGVLGVVPTPLDAVRAAAGITALEPMSALPGGDGRPGLPLLGAFWFEERVAFVERGQTRARRRFTEAHEIVHALCPWHEAVLRTDTRDELFRPVSEAIEAEANAGAGMLIFQGRRFAEALAPADCSLETALALARSHHASAHATLHHYAQAHPGRAAMLTIGRFPRRDGSLPVWRSVESASFRRRHGAAASHYPAGLRAGTPLHALVEAARVTSRCPADTVRLGDGGARFRAEPYYNRHAFMVLLAGR